MVNPKTYTANRALRDTASLRGQMGNLLAVNWININPPTNFSGTLRYGVVLQNLVAVNCVLTVSSGAGAGTITLFNFAGSEWTPLTSQRGAVGFFTNENGSTTIADLAAMMNMRWQAGEGGAFSILGFPGGAAGTGVTEVSFNAIYTLL
jgi:hypothetical protein